MRIAILIFVSTLTYAQGYCDDPNMTPHMCADASFKKAEAEMRDVYSRALKEVTGERRRLLISSQKIWISYRERDCEAERLEWDGGSNMPVANLNCFESHAKARTTILTERYLRH
jgi:uncharacterized protein YecT (DUF1311 family)